MISFSKKFIFIHIPKTGGNSLQNILRLYSEDLIKNDLDYQDGIERFNVVNERLNLKKHSTLKEYYRAFNGEKIDSFKKMFKFSVLRNPWDMMVSLYFSPSNGRKEWDRDTFISVVNKCRTPHNFLHKKNLSDKVIKKIIGNYDSIPFARDIDYLIRFENLDEDFKQVCKRIDIPYEKLPVRNKSGKKHYSRYYDDELIEMVRTKFHKEIEYGEYEFHRGLT